MAKNGTAWVSLEEQETVIQIGRCENHANICTSDTTAKTKYDRLCKENPKHWELISDGGVFSSYRCTPKSLISARAKKVERVYTDEQKKEMAERLSEMRSKRFTE